MLLASLFGNPGRHTRFSNPQTLSEALKIALSVQEAEKQEKFNETSYTRFDEPVRLLSRSPDRAHSGSEIKRRTTDTRAARHSRSQRYSAQNSPGRSETSATRNEQTRSSLRCYECDGIGHYARECPTGLKEAQIPPLYPEKGTRRKVRNIRVP